MRKQSWFARLRHLWPERFSWEQTHKRARSRHHLNVEHLEKREVLDTGLGQIAGLTSTASQLFATGLYYDLLHRVPQPSEVAPWAYAADHGISHTQIAKQLATGDEYNGQLLQTYYHQFLGRDPSAGEISYWTPLMGSAGSMSEENVKSTLVASNEYYKNHGASTNSWLQGVYQDVLGRPADGGGLAYFTQMLQQGTTRLTVASIILHSPEAHTRVVTSYYQQILERAPDATGLSWNVSLLNLGLRESTVVSNLAGGTEYAGLQTTAQYSSNALPGSATSWTFEFGSMHSPLASGDIRTPVVNYNATRGFGWTNVIGMGWGNHPAATALDQTLNSGKDSTFLANVPNGTYTITLTLGDAYAPHKAVTIYAQGVQLATGLSTQAGQFLQPSYSVVVNNGQLAVRLVDQSTNSTFAIDGLSVTPASSTPPAPSAPTATFGNGGGVDLGSSATVSFTGATGGSGGYTYSYDFNSTGTFDISNSTGTSATVPASDLTAVGPHVVHGRITDSSNGFTDYTTTITVNALPTATLVNGGAVDLGSSASVSFSGATGGSSGYKYSYDFNNTGTFDIVNSTATSATVPASDLTTAGTHVVHARITDSNNGYTDYTTTITVNALPTGTFGNGGTVDLGTSATVSFSGATGGSGGYRYSYDFNNTGTFDIVNSTATSATVPASDLTAAGPHVVHGRITDSTNGFTDYTTTITVNALPTATLGNGGAVGLGSSATVSFSGAAGGSGGYTYSYDFNNTGTFDIVNSTSTSATVPASDLTTVGPHVVHGRITDSNNGYTDYTTTINVNGLSAPTATFGNGGPVNEGTTGTVSFTNATGGSGGYTYSYDFANNGTFEITGSSSGSATVPASYLDDGPATRIVHGRITDSAGSHSDYTTTITVNDAAPTVSAGGPYVGAPATAITFSATATSTSSADTTGGFTYTWNFGDGTTGSGQIVSHVYAAAGNYTATLTAKDDVSSTASTSVTVGSGFQVAEYATSVLSFSSQYSSSGWSAAQALGAPDTFTYADSSTAWAPSSENGTTEFITVGYTTPVYATGATIHETEGNGFVTNVEVRNATNGSFTTVWSGVDPSQPGTPVNFQPSWSQTTFPVDGLRITVNTNHNMNTWEETDSVQLVGLSGGNGPTAIFNNSGPVNEGSTATVSFSTPAGGSGGYVYSYDFGNNGTFEVSGSTSASATVPESYLDDGPATVVVHGRITDSSGAFSDYTTSIAVNDAPPTVTAGGPYSGIPGSPITLKAMATSPSSADTSAGFTYTWSFGDGTTGSGATVVHAYANAGSYSPTVTATDVEGNSTKATASVTVSAATDLTAPFIVTPYDKIPNFGAHPTVVSAQSGPWSSPSTWSTGVVPTTGDVVSIEPNTTVTYDVVSTAAVDTVVIQNAAHLVFRTDVNTTLTVLNLLVLTGGELQIGTQANPVAAGVKAQVVFSNQAIDTTKDPEQWGHGLIGLGTVTMAGAVDSSTFANLKVEPMAGDTTLTFNQPVTGWAAGDRLVLPDTRAVTDATLATWTSELERPTIGSISADGTVVTLTAPLQYSHPGARNYDGGLDFTPDVGDTTRNVIIHSESATGVRGYVVFTYRATVDIRYTAFMGLGRTRIDLPDNTTYDASGNVTHVGTNESGRYPVQFRHLIGPVATPADGYQYTFVGNTVMCPLEPMPYRWGITIDDSDYGLIQDNVLYNWAGASIMLVEGSETGNVINHNFVVDTSAYWGDAFHTSPDRADPRGTEGDYGVEGVGIWFRGFNNYINNNVVADSVTYGFVGYARFADQVKIPLFQGADTSVASQTQTLYPCNESLLGFSGNEVYGATNSGMTFWWLYSGPNTTGAPRNVLKNFHVWNIYDYGFYGYDTNQLTIDGFVGRGDGTGMVFSDYAQKDLIVTNANIQMGTGIFVSTNAPGTQLIENSYLRNRMNIHVCSMWTSSYTSANIPPRLIVIQNVQFASVPGYATINIDMDYMPMTVGNYMISDKVLVYNYNGVAGNNFQVFYNEQAPGFVPPTSTFNSDGTPALIGSPVAGLTNQQLWNQYGIAVAGAVATGATAQPGIYGLVKAI
jgi:hypothetical protein